MTLQVDISTVTAAMAALSTTGLTILDMSSIRDEYSIRDTPCLAPRPNDFISGMDVKRASYGSSANAKRDVTYKLAYRFFYSPVQAGRGNWETLPGAVAKFFQIIDIINNNDNLSGLIDITVSGNTPMGIVVDGNENEFYGCDVLFSVLQYVN